MATRCFFASDLHGRARRYDALFGAIREFCPDAVFLGGDLLPFPPGAHGTAAPPVDDFVHDYFIPELGRLRGTMDCDYPHVFLIAGNDDPAAVFEPLTHPGAAGLWTYAHGKATPLGDYVVLGYSCVPPTPFSLKDWERYDTGRHVPPGAVSPEEGARTLEVPEHEARYATITEDLRTLAGSANMDRAILLAHTPPYRTNLDRAALDGKSVDHVPLDVHVGSVAVRRFLEERGPMLSLHGHIHESARLTGDWRDRVGRTYCLSAAHDGPELALVRFDLEDLDGATRILL
jgi:Icc-related predicted phosphoesterase